MSLYICKNCGAKFAKLEKLHCQTCDQYECPACTQCYCDIDYSKKSKDIGRESIDIKESPAEDRTIFTTIEYAKYLLNKENLQMKGYLQYTGQRTIVSERYNKKFLISDFMFYDKTGVLPLRIFGPVPLNYFKYRFGMNKVLLEGVSIRMFKGNFELVLTSRGKITLLKNKQSQSLLKYLSNDAEKVRI